MIVTKAGCRTKRRPAATLVEGAFVIAIFLLFLFGIFEYARYLMFLHVATNAIRDAGRYASVNVDKPSNFPTVDYVSGTKTYTNITSFANTRLAGTTKMLDAGWKIEVFACDQTYLNMTPPQIMPKGGSIGAVPWNSSSFTERICVRLDGTYRMALPSLLYANPSIKVNIAAVVGTEG